MKRIVFFFLLLFTWIKAVKPQNIDSLKQSLFIAQDDTNRVFSLLRLSNAYCNFERDTAMQYAQEALTLAQESNFDKGEAQSLNMVGSILEGISNYPGSFDYRIKSLKIAEEIKNLTLIAALYNNLARVSTELADYKTALEYLFKAKNLFIAQNKKEFLSDVLLNIGDNYERMGLLDSALLYQHEALTLATNTGYFNNMGTILSNLGSINSKMGDYDSAEIYFRNAVTQLLFNDDKESLAGTYYELSKHFEKVKKIDSSLIYGKKSFTLSMEISDQKKILNAAKQLSLLFENKSADSALHYTKISNQIRDTILSADRVALFENMKISEQIRQGDLARERARIEKNRKNNLRLLGIAIFILTFFSILIIVSRRRGHPKALKYLGLLGLLLLFEFIAIFVHPYIDELTGHQPIWMLIILVMIAAVLVPLHHKMEHWVKEHLAKGLTRKIPATPQKENPVSQNKEKLTDTKKTKQ